MNILLICLAILIWMIIYAICKIAAKSISRAIVYFRYKNVSIPLGVNKRNFIIERDILKRKASRDEYILYWNLFTRIISTLHACICVSGVLYCYIIYGNEIFEFNIHTTNLNIIESINILTFTYLIVDCYHIIVERTENGILAYVIHHVVGIVGMFSFAYFKILPYNSLYFTFTEITTISLNISWILSKFKLEEESSNKKLMVAGITTWILWLAVRIFGFVVLVYKLIEDKNQIMELDLYKILILIFANAILMMMNIYWYIKLTFMIIGKLNAQLSNQIDD